MRNNRIGGEPTIIECYKEMYEFTHSLCDCDFSVCSCCDPGYCVIADEWAKAVWGVTLQLTGNSKLLFMGDKGCVVPPHLRPMCTVHVCEKFLFLPDRSTKYRILREAIEDLEWKLHGDVIDGVIRRALQRVNKPMWR